MSDTLKISYSSASKYKTCPHKFYTSKVYSSKEIPSSLAFGKAIEEGVEALLLGKTIEEANEIFINNWTTEALSDNQTRAIKGNSLVAYYASDFDSNLIQDGIFEEDWLQKFDDIAASLKKDKVKESDLNFYNEVMWECLKTRGLTMIKAFNIKLLPKLKLIEVDGKPAAQESITIENSDGDKIVGYVDFVVKHEDYEFPVIVDLKTAGYPYPAHALTTSDQLRTYVAAGGAKYDTNLAGYIVLIKKIKAIKRCEVCGAPKEGLARSCKACGKGKFTNFELDADVQFIVKAFDDEELNDVLSDYTNISTAIKNNITYKNANNCTQYGRQCEFYQHCWNKKRLEDLEHLEKVNKKDLTKLDSNDTVE